MRRILLFLVLVTASPAKAAVTYEANVRPLFKKHCTSCHNPDKKKADLDLSTYAGVLAGSSGGEIVKAGVPDTSWLFESITHADGVEPMPPKKPKIPEAAISTIREWIQKGLVENTGGKSMLRNITFDVTSISSAKPEEEPAMPTDLPPVELHETERTPAITALAASPWAPLVALSWGEQIILRHAETEVLLGVLPFPEGDVFDLKFSRNGAVLVAAGGRGAASGKVILFDVKTGKRIAEIGDEEDVVLSADLSADHRFVALGGPARVVKIFDATNGELLHRIEKHTDWVTAIAFAPEGDQLATADRAGGIHVWEAETGGIVYTLDEHKVHVADLAWRADGKMLASGADDGKLVLWDMKDGWPSKVVDAHKGEAENRYTRGTGILALAWSREGNIITAGRDRKVRFWKPDGGLTWESEAMESLPITAAVYPDATMGWLGMNDGNFLTLRFE